MALGFASAQAEQTKQSAKQVRLTPIAEIQANLSKYFSEIKDPRVTRTKKHLLKDILVIAILAVIAGAEGWEDIENYGISKQEWLTEFLELPNGIPSDDTFRRVFERLDSSAIENGFTKWVQQLIPSGRKSGFKMVLVPGCLSVLANKMTIATARRLTDVT